MELDAQILESLSRYGDEFLHDLFETYLALIPERIEGIRSGIAGGDLESAAKSAHSLRSSSVSIGGSETGECAAAVERALRASAAGELPGLVSELERSLAELEELLRRRVAGGG